MEGLQTGCDSLAISVRPNSGSWKEFKLFPIWLNWNLTVRKHHYQSVEFCCCQVKYFLHQKAKWKFDSLFEWRNFVPFRPLQLTLISVDWKSSNLTLKTILKRIKEYLISVLVTDFGDGLMLETRRYHQNLLIVTNIHTISSCWWKITYCAWLQAFWDFWSWWAYWNRVFQSDSFLPNILVSNFHLQYPVDH